MAIEKGMVLVAVSLAVLQHFSSVVANPEEASCKFLSSVPTNINQTIGHSGDNQAVVSASGYLRYYGRGGSAENFRYMPLQFKSFKMESDALVLNADCAQIYIFFEESGQDWAVDTVTVILNIGNNGAFICELEDPKINQEHGKHFGCNLKNKSYVCSAEIHEIQENVKIVDVVFETLEFELYGSPEKTKINQFTTTC